MSSQDHNSQPSLPRFWNITHPKNLFFTGREEVLTQLRTTLENGHMPVSTRPLAICGLGGIGKTQIVLEYVYSSLSLYHAILWVRADSRAEIISSYIAIAALLDLPQQNEKDETQVIAAVMNWLQTQKKWLLIFDNGDDPNIVTEGNASNCSSDVGDLLTTPNQL
ncbi:MAG TPA: hypothetical protein VN207_02805 [Ktedonobacteraceae bacterium]|nr:hypothetical protein [Ktedonobacteraceae bacterium]